ncbi:hypothetical protein MOSE0_C03158 [Monosporozyma servazzii]
MKSFLAKICFGGTTSLKKTLNLLDCVTTSSSTSDLSLVTPEDSYSPLANFIIFKNESSLTGSVSWPAAIRSLNHLRSKSNLVCQHRKTTNTVGEEEGVNTD